MFDYKVEYLENGVWNEVENFVRPIIDKATLDETHDETQLFISLDEREEAYKPFTRFVITIYEYNDNDELVDTKILYRVVGLDKVTQKYFNETELYDHDIVLYESTKELERYIVDNLSFTNTYTALYTQGKASVLYNSVELKDTLAQKQIYDLIEFWSNAGLALAPINYEFIPDNIYNTPYLQDNNVKIIDYNFQTKGNITFSNAWFTWEEFEYNATMGNIKITAPNGTITNVAIDDNVTLTQLGNYKVTYTITDLITQYSYSLWGAIKTTTHYRIPVRQSTIEYTFEVKETYPETILISIYKVLQRLVEITPTRYKSDTNIKFSLADSLVNRYSDTESPEFIFTNKNLWEVLKEIGGVINAIPYLNISNKDSWNTIDFFELSSEEQESNSVENEYCNSTHEFDTENYTSNYDISVDNMINPLSAQQGKVSELGYAIGKSYRSEEIEISEDNFIIETDYPIYKINHMYFIDTDNSLKEITANVVEKAVYYAKRSIPDAENDYDCKNFFIYFTQGQQSLKGLTYKTTQNIWTALNDKITIKNIIEYVGGTYALGTNKFRIDYIPYIKARVKIYKTNAPYLQINGSMIQNQSSNIIDATALGKKMVSNIGRTGNRSDLDSFKVFSLSALPEKGQRTTDKYFVNTIYTEYDQNHLLSTISYVKDYQKISEYININSRQRYYEISEKQSLDRFINTKMFYIFGDAQQENNKTFALNSAIDYPDVNYMADLFIGEGGRQINASILEYYSLIDVEGEQQYALISTIYKNSNTISTGNCINIITDMYDNYGAGYKAINYTHADTTQGYITKAVQYPDDNGFVDYVRITNVTDSNVEYSSGANLTTIGRELPDLSNISYNVVNNDVTGATTLTFSTIGCQQEVNISKDNREILHFNQQHHFLSNNPNVIVGNAMTDKCRFIQNIEFTTRLVFLSNPIDDYEFKISESDIISSTTITSGNIGTVLNITDNSARVEIAPNYSDDKIYSNIVTGLSETAYAWAIITNTNDLIVGRNETLNNGNRATSIFMNITDNYLA